MESYEIGIRGIPCHQGLLSQDRLYHLQFYENQAIAIVFRGRRRSVQVNLFPLSH